MPERHEVRPFYIFCVELHFGLYNEHLNFHDFVGLLPAALNNKFVHVRNFECHMQLAGRCAPW